ILRDGVSGPTNDPCEVPDYLRDELLVIESEVFRFVVEGGCEEILPPIINRFSIGLIEHTRLDTLLPRQAEVFGTVRYVVKDLYDRFRVTGDHFVPLAHDVTSGPT